MLILKPRFGPATRAASAPKMVENGKPVNEVAQALGIGENLIYRWENAIKPKLGLDKRGKNEDPNNLMIENQALRENQADGNGASNFKKSLGHFQPSDLKLIYEHICELSELFPIYLICQVLQVSRSAFYAYQSGESYQSSPTKKAHCEQVRRVFIENKRRYGSRRILAQIQDLGLKIGSDSIRAVMKRENLKAIQPESFVPKTTDSKHGKRNSPNLLLETEGNRLPLAQAPNLV